MTAQLIPADRHPDLATEWCALEAEAETTPFSSWAWVSTWLDHLPPALRPQLFRAADEHGVFALGLLVAAPERGAWRLLGQRVLHLQETGIDDIDSLTIDYNGLLVRRGTEHPAYALLFQVLAHWFARGRNLRICASTHGAHVLAALPSRLSAFHVHGSLSYLINLAAIARSGGDYLGALGSQTRSGLRRTRRAYQALGDLRFEAARSPEQADEYFEQLGILHERYWRGKGKRGAFGNAFFRAFHRSLIRNHAGNGLTQLARVMAGATPIGYLYNLVWRNRVYFYNSGLNYGLLPGWHDRPGYLAHMLAIEHYLAGGLASYDFLAGEAAYKRALSTHAHPLAWIVLKPHGWRLQLDTYVSRYRSMRCRPLAAVLAEHAGEERESAVPPP